MGLRLFSVAIALLAVGTTSHPAPTRTTTPWSEPTAVQINPPATRLPYNPGGPRLPVEDLPPHTRVSPGTPGSPAFTFDACTSTMDITYSRLPTAPYWAQCSFDGTDRSYPSTTTVYRQVDCRGCSNLLVQEHPRIECPAMRITASATMATPSTKYETLCSPTPVVDHIQERQVLLSIGAGIMLAGACPTTIYVTAGHDSGPISTVYRQIVPQVQKVDCGGCSLVVSTRLGGLGPIYRPSSTTTGAIATSTSYQCQ